VPVTPWICAIATSASGVGSGCGSGSGPGSLPVPPEFCGVTVVCVEKSAELTSVSTPADRAKEFGVWLVPVTGATDVS
jgi:hypothetical protein